MRATRMPNHEEAGTLSMQSLRADGARGGERSEEALGRPRGPVDRGS